MSRGGPASGCCIGTWKQTHGPCRMRLGEHAGPRCGVAWMHSYTRNDVGAVRGILKWSAFCNSAVCRRGCAALASSARCAARASSDCMCAQLGAWQLKGTVAPSGLSQAVLQILCVAPVLPATVAAVELCPAAGEGRLECTKAVAQ